MEKYRRPVKTFHRKYHCFGDRRESRKIVLRLCEIRGDLVWNIDSSSALNTERNHDGLLPVQISWSMTHYRYRLVKYRLPDWLTNHSRCYSRQNRQGPNWNPIVVDRFHSRLKYRLIHRKFPVNFQFYSWNSELSWHETGDSWNKQTEKKWNVHIFCYL